jgi:Fe-S cluster biogenesis protein NfuA
MNEAAIEAALESLRPAMEADGFDLRLAERQPGEGLMVVLEARPGACMECLVPDDVLTMIISDAIRRNDIVGVGHVSLVKKGFDR